MFIIKTSIDQNIYLERKELETKIETLLTSKIRGKATTFSKIGVNVAIDFDTYKFCEQIGDVWDRIEQDLCEKHAIYMR